MITFRSHHSRRKVRSIFNPTPTNKRKPINFISLVYGELLKFTPTYDTKPTVNSHTFGTERALKFHPNLPQKDPNTYHNPSSCCPAAGAGGSISDLVSECGVALVGHAARKRHCSGHARLCHAYSVTDVVEVLEKGIECWDNLKVLESRESQESLCSQSDEGVTV